MTVKEFTKGCFIFWFYNFINKIGKNKEDDDNFLRKKSRRKAKQYYHNDICRWKKDNFSNEVKITGGIV